MTPIGKVVYFTVVSWVHILSFFYLPNAIWGIMIKIIAGIWLLGFFLNLTSYQFRRLFGSIGKGFILNAVCFTIINLRPPQWIALILWFLIIVSLGTCYKILKSSREARNKAVEEMEL